MRVAVCGGVQMELSMNMLLSILGVAGGRAYQVYYSANIARQQVGGCVCVVLQTL